MRAWYIISMETHRPAPQTAVLLVQNAKGMLSNLRDHNDKTACSKEGLQAICMLSRVCASLYGDH